MRQRLAAVLVAWSLAGCSFFRSYEPSRPDGCAAHAAAVDTLLAAAAVAVAIVGGIVVANADSAQSAYDYSLRSVAIGALMIIGGSPVAIGYGAGAVYGFAKVADCRRRVTK
jgi:hypothetical protein